MNRLYTGKGDDGTTGLLFGGRVSKSDAVIHATGAVDEAQAWLGLIRAESQGLDNLGDKLVQLERDLYVLMAELATSTENRAKLIPNQSLVSQEMLAKLTDRIDELGNNFRVPDDFVIPGQNRLSAMLDIARTVIRRAERWAVGCSPSESLAVPYLNRLSSLLWVLARVNENESLPSKE